MDWSVQQTQHIQQISSESAETFLRYFAQKYTHKHTHMGENITSFRTDFTSAEVTISLHTTDQTMYSLPAKDVARGGAGGAGEQVLPLSVSKNIKNLFLAGYFVSAFLIRLHSHQPLKLKQSES